MKRPIRWEKVFWHGKNVGLLKSDRTEFLSVRNKCHFFRKFNGFGISKELLMHLENMGVLKIKIVYLKDENKIEVWKTYLNIFFRKGILYQNGSDVQLILPREYWRVENEPEKEIVRESAEVGSSESLRVNNLD